MFAADGEMYVSLAKSRRIILVLNSDVIYVFPELKSQVDNLARSQGGRRYANFLRSSELPLDVQSSVVGSAVEKL